MADSVGAYVLDNGLSALDTLADKIYICSGEPTNYTTATTAPLALGLKDFGTPGAAVGAPAPASPNGSAVATVAVPNGTTTATGTATHWAIVGSAGSLLLAHGALAAGVAVVSGGLWGLGSFSIRLPNQ